MNSWQITPYFYFYLAVAVASFIFAIVGLKLKNAKGNKYFCLMLLGTGLWSLGYLLGFFNTNLPWKLIMVRVEYLGSILAAYFWLIFAISYTQYEQKLTPKRMFLMAIVPVVTFLEVLTFNYHTFFYKSYGIEEGKNLILFTKVYSLGFYIWIMYAYILDLSGALIFIWGMLHKPMLYRRQIIPIAVSVIILMLPNLLYITHNNPIAPYDPTPLALFGVGLIFLFILKRYQLFDIAPVAHHLVFKNVKSGVIVIDKESRILEMNPSAERIIGKSQNEVLGTKLSEAFPDYEKILNGKSVVAQDSLEIEVQHKKRFFELKTTPLVDYTNNVAGNIILLYDITERQQTLNDLNAFARTVAHDLKNPLALQSNFAELLSADFLSEDERKEALNAIIQSSKKMVDIVDSLLLLSNVRNSNDVDIKPLNMAEVVNHALARLGINSSEKEIKITCAEKWPVVRGYAPWVEEIWVNYICNALKYGGTPPIIEIGSDRIQSSIRFWVKDNGEGLTPDEQRILFKEFTRLKRHLSGASGHGLGLSIVRRIAEKLGGEVGVESDGKTGSTFYFTLEEYLN